MKITKRQLKRIIREVLERDEDQFTQPSPEEDAEYDRGYDDGFNGYPQDPAGGPGYYPGYESGENAAADEDELEEGDAMMGVAIPNTLQGSLPNVTATGQWWE